MSFIDDNTLILRRKIESALLIYAKYNVSKKIYILKVKINSNESSITTKT
jgi:hypothetical protein